MDHKGKGREPASIVDQSPLQNSLIQAQSPPSRPLLNTGLRRGEFLGLAWERVDLSRGVIRLEVTKSGRRRELPMNDALRPPRARAPSNGGQPP
jgi:integrase